MGLERHLLDSLGPGSEETECPERVARAPSLDDTSLRLRDQIQAPGHRIEQSSQSAPRVLRPLSSEGEEISNRAIFNEGYERSRDSCEFREQGKTTAV